MHAVIWVIDPVAFLFRGVAVVPAAILAATLALTGLSVAAVVAAGARTTGITRPRHRHRQTKDVRAEKDAVP